MIEYTKEKRATEGRGVAYNACWEIKCMQYSREVYGAVLLRQDDLASVQRFR